MDEANQDDVRLVHEVDVVVEGADLIRGYCLAPARVLGPLGLPGFEDQDGALLGGERWSKAGEARVGLTAAAPAA